MNGLVNFGSVGHWVGGSMGKWSVVGWSVVGGSVVGGFNKTPYKYYKLFSLKIKKESP